MTRDPELNFALGRAVARRVGGIVLGLSGLATALATAQAADTAARVAEFRRSADASAAEARGLEARRPAVISGSIVMNTVRQFPRRQELDGYLAERTTEARAWEAKVAAGTAQRTAVLNPYTRSTYTRYYDDKGDWQFSVIENDYRATEKLQEDWSREFRRARATLEGLQREYDDLVADGDLQTAQQSELAAMLASATQRMGEFGSPPPELLPRPVEGDTNSPHPSYRVFDGLTGQLIEIGSTGGGGRPVADGPPAAGQPAEPKAGAGGPPAGGGAPRPPAQTFKLYIWQNSSGLMFRGIYDSLEAARAAGERHMSERGQKGYCVTDGSTDPTTTGSEQPPPSAKIVAKRDRY